LELEALRLDLRNEVWDVWDRGADREVMWLVDEVVNGLVVLLGFGDEFWGVRDAGCCC
jgi:hypothetical protein